MAYDLFKPKITGLGEFIMSYLLKKKDVSSSIDCCKCNGAEEWVNYGNSGIVTYWRYNLGYVFLFEYEENDITIIDFSVIHNRPSSVWFLSSYEEMFVVEYQQLLIQYKELLIFIEKCGKGKLDFKPSYSISSYIKKLSIMKNCIKELEKRANNEGINLS